jgi:hypothetical protein
MGGGRGFLAVSDRDHSKANDEPISLKVMGDLNGIVSDGKAQSRRVVSMRWGFQHPKNWHIPQPIHARCRVLVSLLVSLLGPGIRY